MNNKKWQFKKNVKIGDRKNNGESNLIADEILRMKKMWKQFLLLYILRIFSLSSPS